MTEILFRLVVDEKQVRESYEEYVGDVKWYVDNGKLDPDNPDPGYARGEICSYEKYLDGWVQGITDEIARKSMSSWKLERVGGDE